MRFTLSILFFFFTIFFSFGRISYQYERTIPIIGSPKGFCMDQNQNLLIALASENKVIRMTKDGALLQTIQSGFNSPCDVIEDAMQNIYVADRGNKVVKKFDKNGTLLLTLDCKSNVNGVSLNPDGDLYVATLLDIQVYKKDQLDRTLTTLSKDKFREVRKAVFTKNATYFIDKNSGVFSIQDDKSNPVGVHFLAKKYDDGRQLNYLAYGVCNEDGEIIVSSEGDKDQSLRGVYRLSSTGSIIDTIGQIGASTAVDGFSFPCGLAIDEEKNLFVADFTQKSIKVWKEVDLSPLEILASKITSVSSNSLHMLLRVNKSSSFYYKIRKTSEAIASKENLRTQSPVSLTKNILNQVTLSFSQSAVDSLAVDYLVEGSNQSESDVNTEKFALNEVLSTDFKTIKDRYLELLIGSEQIDYTNERINARYQALLAAIPSALTEAQKYVLTDDLEPFDLDGSSSTADVVTMRNICQKVFGPLSLVYQIPGPLDNPNPYFQNKEILETILHMYRYTQARNFSYGCVLPFSGGGVYLRLTGYFYASLLMQHELKQANLWNDVERTLDWATRWVNDDDLEWGASVVNNTSKSDGIRTLYNNRFIYALVATQGEEVLGYLQKTLNNNFLLGSAWNGFLKPDYSAYHHLGPWGNAYIIDALHVGTQLAWVLRDTHYALSTTSLENLTNGLIALAQYSAKYDAVRGMCGRFPNQLSILYSHISAYTLAHDFMVDPELKSAVQTIYDDLYDPSITTVLSDMVKKVDFDITFYGGLGVIEKCEKDKDPNFSFPGYEINRVFPYAALQIHRREDWMVAVKGYSKYVWDFETNGGENWYGRNQAHGSLAIYNGKNKEGIVTAEASGWGYNGYDWSHVAGTTTFCMPLNDIYEEAQNFQWAKFSPEYFVGGVSLKNNGVYAMKYADIRQAYDYGNNRKWLGIKLKANKSVFFFDNMLVCLGSEINNTHEKYDAHTTLFQNFLKEEDTPISVNDLKINYNDYSFRQEGNDPMMLTDAAGNTYYLENGQNVCVTRELQTSYKDNGNKTTTTGNYAKAWIDHGKTKNGKFQYTVFVNGLKETSTFHSQDYYTIERQDSIAHIVRSNDKKGYVLFNVSKPLNDEYILSASQPTILMIQEMGSDEIAIGLSNPELGFYDKNAFPYQVWSIPASKQYLMAEEQPVDLVLNGRYTIANSDESVQFLNYSSEKNETTFRFKSIHGATIPALIRKESSTDIKNLELSDVKIYPTLAQEYLTVETSYLPQKSKIAIYDLLGHLVYESSIQDKKSKLDIQELHSGTYMVQILDQKLIFIKE